MYERDQEAGRERGRRHTSVVYAWYPSVVPLEVFLKISLCTLRHVPRPVKAESRARGFFESRKKRHDDDVPI